MSGITIGWSNTDPTATDLVGQGDDVIRSLKSNLQGALDAEHTWPSAGGYSGLHRKGSARVFVGTSSQVSSADTDGRLMYNTSVKQLVYLDSSSSVVVGGVGAIHGPASGTYSVATQRLVMEMGTISIVSSDVTQNQTFGESYVAAPFVQVGLSNPARPNATKGPFAPYVLAVNTSGFSCVWQGVEGGSASATSVTFIAIGKVAYP